MADETTKRSPVFNWETGEFTVGINGSVVTVTAEDAVKEIVVKAQQTTRGLYLIYADTEDADNDHIYGSDTAAVLTQKELTTETRVSELQRAIKEAIIYDPWVTDVTNISIYAEDGKMYASYTISTIFDTNLDIEGVNIDG